MSTQKRILGLDIVRTLAILLVLLCHLSYPFYPFLTGFAERLYNLSVWVFGYYGVEIFFVLSGFLIGGIFVREFASSEIGLPENTSLKRFWVRRWARTLPNYYLFVLVNWLIARFMLGEQHLPVLPYLLFVQKVLPSQILPYFGVSWSLAVEEWFYLLMPVSFFLFHAILRNPRLSFKMVIGTMLLLPITVKWFYAIGHAQLADYENVYHFTTGFRLDSIAFGLLLSYLLNDVNIRQRILARKKMLLGIGILITILNFGLIGFFLAKPLQHAYAFAAIMPFISFGVSCCLPFFATWNEFSSHKRLERAFIYCSKVSYSLYLVHIPVMLLCEDWYKRAGIEMNLVSSLIKYLLIMTATFVISSFIYRYFELPVMKIRDRKTK